MPRVSQEHRDRRRQQILRAARRCFVREGFHQTSMAEIIAESGLSAGAIYGHFKSKNQIIIAIAGQVIGQISQLLEPIFTQDPPPRLDEAILQGLRATDELAFGEEGFATLAPQVWAEAQRDSALAGVIQDRYRPIHHLVSQLVTAEQKVGRVSADGDPDEVAKILIGMIMGYILQRLLIGNVEPVSYSRALGSLVPQQ